MPKEQHAAHPLAIQVADRFHLLCNLTSAVERVLEQKRTAHGRCRTAGSERIRHQCAPRYGAGAPQRGILVNRRAVGEQRTLWTSLCPCTASTMGMQALS
jgi:hypothetical protein